MHVLSPEGCFPFAKKRNGTVLGEGAGILVMEEPRARQGARRQHPGRAAAASACRPTPGHGQPGHRGTEERHAARARRCRSRRLRHRLSQRSRHRHGHQRRQRDATPSRTSSANTPTSWPISSTKSMHGHPLGAGGGIEAVACIKAIEEDWVPPTIGLDEPDPGCDLDYVPNVGRARSSLRDVELVRVRRPQRGPRVRRAAGLT